MCFLKLGRRIMHIRNLFVSITAEIFSLFYYRLTPLIYYNHLASSISNHWNIIMLKLLTRRSEQEIQSFLKWSFLLVSRVFEIMPLKRLLFIHHFVRPVSYHLILQFFRQITIIWEFLVLHLNLHLPHPHRLLNAHLRKLSFVHQSLLKI